MFPLKIIGSLATPGVLCYTGSANHRIAEIQIGVSVMKKLFSWILILVTVLALAGCGQQTPQLKGSYSTGGSALGLNLVFDEKGHFCLYTQEEGLLAQGNYLPQDHGLYALQGVSGYAGTAILTEEGLYYVSERPAQQSAAPHQIDFLTRYSEVPTFTGEWAKDWEHFPDGPYRTAAE